jgi:hypothetical protein
MKPTVHYSSSGARVHACVADAGCLSQTCQTCLREIPESEALSDEAVDYVSHFCGLDCLQRWRKQVFAAASGH